MATVLATVNRNTATLSDEADIIGWYAPDEIKGLDLTIPTEDFLKKLGSVGISMSSWNIISFA